MVVIFKWLLPIMEYTSGSNNGYLTRQPLFWKYSNFNNAQSESGVSICSSLRTGVKNVISAEYFNCIYRLFMISQTNYLLSKW